MAVTEYALLKRPLLKEHYWNDMLPVAIPLAALNASRVPSKSEETSEMLMAGQLVLITTVSHR